MGAQIIMHILEANEFQTTARTLGGIDTLYYFYETNKDYDDLFLDILDQLEDAKALFQKRDIAYQNNDIEIEINKYRFTYGGKKEGFYWLNSVDSLFTFGFKDYKTNRNLNDIQVQINATAIYTIGLSAVLKLAEDVVKGYITGYRPITRVDINVFVQADFTWVKSDMFIARQMKRETIIKEIALSRKTETIYIGSNPFLFRMYDKLAEMSNSKKKEIMEEYLQNFEFSIEEPITNIEFEMHRAYLKRFNIKTVDDVLANVEQLFKQSMDSIRLVDLDSLTEVQRLSNNRNRATTLPIWEHIKESYTAKEFLQLDLPLERMKRKLYTFTRNHAIKEYVALERKFYINRIAIDEEFLDDVQDYKELQQKKNC
jgi:hypothetical protein